MLDLSAIAKHRLVNILLIGDIVGKPGQDRSCSSALPGCACEAASTWSIANAENAAGGSGITPEIYRELHGRRRRLHHAGRPHLPAQRNRRDPGRASARIVKPANFPRAAPGRDWAVVPRRQRRRRGRVQPAGPGLHAARRLPVDTRRPGAGRNPAATSSSACSTSTPRPPATSNSWDATSTDASARCWAPTPTCRPPTNRSCPAAPRSSATSA